MKHLLSIALFALILSGCFAPINYSQPEYARQSSGPQEGMPSKPGACYARCLIQDKYEVYSEELMVFTGDQENTDAAIETIDFEVTPATTKWVKKKADKNCLSADPEDCLVWCLQEIPAEVERLIIVTDTTSTDEFQIRTFEKKRLEQEGGFTEWREVLCEKDIDKHMIESIQNALSDRGYYNGLVNGVISSTTKEALVLFQKDNGFPVGQLDFESLDGLEVVH